MAAGKIIFCWSLLNLILVKYLKKVSLVKINSLFKVDGFANCSTSAIDLCKQVTLNRIGVLIWCHLGYLEQVLVSTIGYFSCSGSTATSK